MVNHITDDTFLRRITRVVNFLGAVCTSAAEACQYGFCEAEDSGKDSKLVFSCYVVFDVWNIIFVVVLTEIFQY